MQKLKCIGGACNGRIVEVDSYYREHDQVPVRGKIEFDIIDFEKDLDAFRNENMTTPVHFYKVSVISFKHSKLKFLIPVKWDAEEALCYVLGA